MASNGFDENDIALVVEHVLNKRSGPPVINREPEKSGWSITGTQIAATLGALAALVAVVLGIYTLFSAPLNKLNEVNEKLTKLSQTVETVMARKEDVASKSDFEALRNMVLGHEKILGSMDLIRTQRDQQIAKIQEKDTSQDSLIQTLQQQNARIESKLDQALATPIKR